MSRKPLYIVSFGGGVTSAEALKRTLDKHGPDQTVAVFADVGQVRDQQGRVVDGECDDLYRFMDEVSNFLNFPIHRIRSKKYGPGIWSVFFGERFIANRQVADPCSKWLKRKVLADFVKENFDPALDIMVTGLDFTEPNRIKKFADAMTPWGCYFPLNEGRLVTKGQLFITWSHYGIDPPLLNEEGFNHNNCSGFCVKAGVNHFYKLWKIRPWVFLYHEGKEQEFNQYIKSKIFRTVLKGISLRDLRLKFMGGYIPVLTQKAMGCGGTCVVPQKGEFS